MSDQEDKRARRLVDIEARLAKLEAPKEKKRFLWIFTDWQDMLKVVALPLTFIYGGLEFYDKVWTRSDKEAADAARAGQESIRELQAINAEIFTMNSRGDFDQSQAYQEANRGRISRLVTEATTLWEKQPDYFLPNEKQTLANELLKEERNDIAKEIGEDLASNAKDVRAQAYAALLLGRSTGTRGPGQNLDAMRSYMRQSNEYAQKINPKSIASGITQEIMTAWLFFELYEGTDCKQIGSIASTLRNVTRPLSNSDASIGDQTAAGPLQLYDERCSS